MRDHRQQHHDLHLGRWNSSLTVRFTDAMVSNGLDDNRTVYAEGILRYEDEAYVFDATSSKLHARQSMKKQRATRNNGLRCLDIGWQTGRRWDRWGARRTLNHKSSLWWTERLGAAEAAVGSRRRTLMSRPHMTRVS